MATVAKLGLVGMALGDAGIREAHGIFFSGGRNIRSFAFANNRFFPVVQEVYVAGAHVFGRFDARFLTRRQLQLWRALCTPVKPTVPDRQGSDSEKN